MRATYSPSTCGMHHMSLRQGLRSFSAKPPAHGLPRDAVVLGEPDQFTRQQLQRPTGAALRAGSNRPSRPAGLPLCPRAYGLLPGAALR